ncbi:nucleotidyltransferase [Streptomyces sp. M10(2022)]
MVGAARSRIADAFDASRLHSAYLYGSVPRGSAIPGVSDLDLLLALRDEPTDTDRAVAEETGAALDAAFGTIDGAGVLSSPPARSSVTWNAMTSASSSPASAPRCWVRISPYTCPLPPHPLLARETNGDLPLALPRWRVRAAGAATDAERLSLCRGVARRLVRSAFTLVMPQWGGWTSDLRQSAELFARYYPGAPQRAAQVLVAAATARTPSSDPRCSRC